MMYTRKLCQFIPNLYQKGLLSVAAVFHLPCKNMSSLFHYRNTRRHFLYTNLTENIKVDIEKKHFGVFNLCLWRIIYRRYSENARITLLSGGNSKVLSENEFDEKDKLLSTVVRQLNEDHGVDICVVETCEERKKYADYVVVVSGTSTRHLKAMTNHLDEQSKKGFAGRISTVNGLDSDDWMIVDFGSIVVHLFLPEVRSKYELEKLWSVGPEKDEQYKAMLDDDRFLEIIKNAKLHDFFIKEGNEDEPSIK